MSSASDVDRAFDEYLHRIELNPARVTKISQRYNSVKKQIESQLNGAKVKQVGSFQRKTKIRPITDNDNLDIDALVILSRADRFVKDGLSPSRAMEKVRDSLQSDDTYKTMRPHSDSPVVVLKHASPDESGGTLPMEDIEENWWLQLSEEAVMLPKVARSAARFPAT